MKSTKSLLLVLVLSLAVLAGCNVTVNETPEDEATDDAMYEDSVMEDDTMMEDEADDGMTEEDSVMEDEADDGTMKIEIKDGVGMMEVTPKINPDDLDVDVVEVKLNDDDMMIKVEQ